MQDKACVLPDPAFHTKGVCHLAPRILCNPKHQDNSKWPGSSYWSLSFPRGKSAVAEIHVSLGTTQWPSAGTKSLLTEIDGSSTPGQILWNFGSWRLEENASVSCPLRKEKENKREGTVCVCGGGSYLTGQRINHSKKSCYILYTDIMVFYTILL